MAELPKRKQKYAIKAIPFSEVAEARVAVTELLSVEWVVVMATELVLAVVGEILLGDIVVVMAILEVTGAIQSTSLSNVIHWSLMII